MDEEDMYNFVIESWLKDYEPASLDNKEDIIYMTSADIVDELAEILEVSLADIVSAMISHGFKIGQSPENKVCWLMIRKG